MKKFLWVIAYAVLLVAFTFYSVLVYNSADAHIPEIPEITQDIISTDTCYWDGNILITIAQYREYETEIYVAEVIIKSPEYLRTALAKNQYGKNIIDLTSDTAKANGALFAVNGDFYGVRNDGYVIRNGELFRNVPAERDTLVIGKDGSFNIVKDTEVTAEELLENGAAHAISFGPSLIENSQLTVNTESKVDLEWASNPRTAIGIVGEGHYLFVVSDGRLSDSKGLSIFELASFMRSLGVTDAYNLDGGGSATMYFNGRVVNRPTTQDQIIAEREVSDIVYIGY